MAQRPSFEDKHDFNSRHLCDLVLWSFENRRSATGARVLPDGWWLHIPSLSGAAGFTVEHSTFRDRYAPILRTLILSGACSDVSV